MAQMVKKYAYNAGEQGSIPGSGRSPGEGNGYPLQFSCLENFMHRATWQAIVFVSLIFSSRYKSYYSSARWDLDEKQAASQASDFTEDRVKGSQSSVTHGSDPASVQIRQDGATGDWWEENTKSQVLQ